MKAFDIKKISEKEACDLIIGLIKEYHIDKEDIEVIYFPKGCKRSEVLASASRNYKRYGR